MLPHHSAKPTLVLLPGMDGTGDLFAPFVEAVGDEFRTQIVRYPTDQVLGYDELVTLVRQSLPTDDPYVLLGESFSGPVAIAIAAENPPLLKGLVLCCTFARNPRPGLAGLKHLLPLLPFAWTPSEVLSRFLLGPFATSALRRALARAVGRVTPAVLRGRLRAVIAVDVSAPLARVHVSCLYLQATQDCLVPEAVAAHLQAMLPSMAVVQIDAPHGLLQAAPDLSLKALNAFVRKIS